MSEPNELTPEEIAQEFNRREWRGRKDWRYAPTGNESMNYFYFPSVIPQYDHSIGLYDARALLVGWRAQEELAALKAADQPSYHISTEALANLVAYWSKRAAEDGLEPWYHMDAFEAMLDLQRARLQLATLTAERDELKRIAACNKVEANREREEQGECRQALAALTAEVERLHTELRFRKEDLGAAVMDGDIAVKEAAPHIADELRKEANYQEQRSSAHLYYNRGGKPLVLDAETLRPPTPDLDAEPDTVARTLVDLDATEAHLRMMSINSAFRATAFALLAEVRRLRKENEPQVGSWEWALAQMKAGLAVKRSEWVTTGLLLREQSCHPKRRFVWSGKGRDVMMEIWPDWYDATDWQLADTDKE